MLDCGKVAEKTKRELRKKHRTLDPIDLAQSIEEKLAVIMSRVDRIEEERAELEAWANEAAGESNTSGEIPGSADLRGVVPPSQRLSNRVKSLPERAKSSRTKPSPECHET